MKRLVSLGLVIGLGFGIVPVAGAQGASARKTISITGAHHDDDGWIGFYPQSCGPTQNGICTVKTSGIVHWSGPLEGISEYTSYTHYDQDTQKIRVDTWEWFTVNLKGCGYGRFLTHAVALIPPVDLIMWQDPTSLKMQAGDATWNYVPGTATGDLTNMSSLTFTAEDIEFEWGTFENHGEITGTAVCGK